MSHRIELAIKQSNWPKARRYVLADLRKEPASHWLISRLALTYYEERDYERSLVHSKRAYKIAPYCPLVLWDLAGTYQMLGRYQTAIAAYRRLLRRGINTLAFGPCGEGVAWARGLMADCWYRLARCHKENSRRAEAIRSYRKHLALRGPGCRSIYSIRDVRRELALLLRSADGRVARQN